MRFAVLILAGCGRIGFDSTDPPPDPGDSHLVAHYPMDTLASNAVLDSTGHGFDGTCAADVCPQPDVVDGRNVMRFDGSDELVVASPPRLDTFTVTATFQLVVDPDPGSACMVSQVYEGDASLCDAWQICLAADRTVFFYSCNAAFDEDFLTSPQSTTLNTWVHIAIRWDGAVKSLFLDGALSIAHAAAMPASPAGAVLLGVDEDVGARVSYFPGLVDDVRIYDSALDDDAIAALARP